MKKTLPELIIRAAGRGETEKLLRRLVQGANPDECNEVGFTALMAAAEKGHEDVVKLLISKGATVNAATSRTVSSARGVTALILATRQGNRNVIKRLVQAGANVNAETTWGESPLYEATCRGDLEITKYLISFGAAPTLTVPFAAIQNRQLDILCCVLAAGADSNWQNPKTKDTLLGRAIQFTNDPTFVELLLRSGADPNALSGNRRPLNLAAWQGSLELCKLLLARNARINGQDAFKRTALMDAAFKGREEIVRFLLANGADKRKRDKDGKAAWDLAKEAGYLNLIPLLASKCAK